RVILAWPVGQPPSIRHSKRSSGPAARCMAPSTPPPPRRELFAALTTASTPRVVMSPWNNSSLPPISPVSIHYDSERRAILSQRRLIALLAAKRELMTKKADQMVRLYFGGSDRARFL